MLTLVQKKHKKKKKKKKKSIYQTGARDRIELAVRCERLLHVEGLTVTLRRRTAIKVLFLCFGFCQMHIGISYTLSLPFLLILTRRSLNQILIGSNVKLHVRVAGYMLETNITFHAC